jgi:hypothetical protein
MSAESIPSIQTLNARHGQLDAQIQALPPYRRDEINQLKRQKLLVKDQIARRAETEQRIAA